MSLAGSLVDLADDAVLTITKRGTTSLVDLYGVDGERIGTVETEAAAGGLLLDGRSALIVTRAGDLVRVDFDDESVDEVASIAEHLTPTTPRPTTRPPKTSSRPTRQPRAVRTVVPALDRTRLIVVGQAGAVVIDVEGADRVRADRRCNVAARDDQCRSLCADRRVRRRADTVGPDGRHPIETFDAGFMTGRSADGCTVTYAEGADGAERRRDWSGPNSIDRSRVSSVRWPATGRPRSVETTAARSSSTPSQGSRRPARRQPVRRVHRSIAVATSG